VSEICIARLGRPTSTELIVVRSVPSMVTDIIDQGDSELPLETLSFGGAAPSGLMAARAGKSLPKAQLYVVHLRYF
jgi:hypothetical protein